MNSTALDPAKMHKVNRSDLRQHQSKWLKKAKGQNVLLVKAHDADDEKVVLDRQYFDEICKKLGSLVETLEVVMDRKLFQQILTAANTLEDDLRAGKLHSLEDAFAED